MANWGPDRAIARRSNPLRRQKARALGNIGTGPYIPHPMKKNPACDALRKRGSFFVRYNPVGKWDRLLYSHSTARDKEGAWQ